MLCAKGEETRGKRAT